ncbi:MAG: hypothetical protein EPN89_01710, partial [Methylovulum sp.]
MNTQNQSVQTSGQNAPETAKKANINPDFNHRLSALSCVRSEFILSDLGDSIDLMIDRATSILYLVITQIESDTKASNAIIASSLSAAVAEINDIGARGVAIFAKA